MAVKKFDLREKKSTNGNRPLQINILRTFKYASSFDISLMIAGSLCAIFTGSCLPIAGFIFGSMTDVFISQSLYGLLHENTTAQGVYQMNKTFDASHNGLNVKIYTEREFADVLNVFLVIYLAIGTAIVVSSFIQTLCWEMAGENQVHTIRNIFFSQIIRQDIAWYDKNEDGNLPNKLSDDLEVIRDGIGHKCVMVVQHLSTFVTGVGIGLYVNIYTTLVCLCVGPFLIALTAYNARFSANSMAREQMKYGKAGSVAEETLTNMKIVSAYSGQSIAADKYFEALKEGKKFAMTRYHYLSLCMCITFFFMYAGYGVGFWHGARSVAARSVTPGSVFTVLFSVVAGALTIGQALPYINIVSAAVGVMGSVEEIMNRKVTIDPYSLAGIKPTQLIGHIVFRDVNFAYPTRPLIKILNGLTFDIKPGQVAAIVGSSGAGKSTIVGLLQRFYDVTSGEICIDGVSLKDLNVKWIRSQIGLVSQEPVLFGVSIAENIMYGKRDATRADVEEAAKQANAHNFIIKLPMGYDTLVGDTGSQLSGGQKQRIAIARALIRNPKILLLDEATSALDARSEGIVQETLSKVMRGRTTVIVAHRLSTIKNADIIYVMKNGELFESGTHEALMQKRSLYHSLVLAQMSPTNYLNDSDEHSTDCATEDESEDEEFKIYNNTPTLKIIDEESQSMDCSESIENGLKREELRESKTRNSIEDSEHKLTRTDSYPASRRRRSTRKRSSIIRLKNKENLKTPSPGSEPIEKDITSWGVLKMQKPQAFWLALGVLGSVGVGMIPPLCALLFGQIYYVFTLTGQAFTDAYIFWTWIFFAFSFYCGLMYLIWTKGMCESSEGLLLNCRRKIFVNILRQPVGWFDFETSSPGILISRLARNVPLIKSAAGLRVGQVASSIVTMIGSFIVAVLCGWKLALALAVCVPIFIYAAYKQSLILKRNQWRDALLMDSAGRVASESVRNIRTVKSLGQEQLFTDIYTQHLELPYRESKSIAILYSMVYALMHGTSYYMYAINFRLGGYLVQTGEMASEDIYRVYFALSLCATSVGTSFVYLQDYSRALNAARVLNYLLSRETEIEPDSPYGVKPELQGSVEFKDVHFLYPTRPNVVVLKGVSFTLQAGKTLALVGESGCGKSTVVSLLERYHDPVCGVVSVDGYDIKTINLNHLRSHIGIVNQEPTLFDCSIQENIAYGAKALNIDVTFELIEKVARTANIHDFVMSLPMNYDTVVGERGIQLSGGQKQRIAIARALIRDPKILLLDEATSALDTENEKIVQAALDKAKEGRTCITVAHRLSTIKNADEICVMSNGKIVERGTHDELYALKGHYFELTQRQCV